jgi:malic enzyme
MHDSHDHDRIAIDMVENPVAAMDQTANAFAQIGAGASGHWMLPQERKGGVKSKKIAVCDRNAKLINAVDTNFEQIGARRRA